MLPFDESVKCLKQQLKRDYIESQLEPSYDRRNMIHRNLGNDYLTRPALSSHASSDATSVQNDTLTQKKVIDRCLNNPTNIHMDNTRWKNNPRHFNNVIISRLSCQQILNHAIKGNDNEIMGMLIGTTIGSSFVVSQTFPLPILGTETRVNALAESYEYMVQYMNDMVSTKDKLGHIIGWYHSHPGYDCWLSNIDMKTQDLNQSFQDPYLAIVVDPKKSLHDQAIRIGAFRTINSEKKNVIIDNNETVTHDENLEFYELPTTIYDSDLDNLMKNTHLSYELPKSDMDYENLLFESLFDSMKQINNFNEIIMEEDLNIGKKDNELSTKKLLQSQNSMSRDKLKRNLSTFCLSTNSGDNDSDIEMAHDTYSEKDAELESVTSSIGTVPDNNLSLLRANLNNYQSADNNTGNFSNFQRELPNNSNILESSVSNIAESSDSLHLPNTFTKPHRMEDLTLNLQKHSLHTEYDKSKRGLLRFKLQEYKNLRFYRDTFSL